MTELFHLQETRLKRTAFDIVENEKQAEAIKNIRPDMDIVMTKWAGLYASVILATHFKKELCERFSESYVNRSLKLSEYVSTDPEIKILTELGIDSYARVKTGGVFSTIYEMLKPSDTGCEVFLPDIPILQETIEFAECFGLNPYMILGTGSVIVVCENGLKLTRIFEEQGISANVIGCTTKEKARRIVIPIVDEDDISVIGKTRRRHKREERQLTPVRSDAVAELAGLN
ncbi:MAG: hypothetical protein IKQ71_10165 [Lachnospiraceae bacterium]|nr:hypothetical protein [Lachnospiraceae bacterium]